MLQPDAIAQFRGQLRGELIEPTYAIYEEARKVYNAMISRQPRLIARCADVADVVRADGSFAVASADENSDLFWAIRGGGGNFGVVTSFLFQAHPVHTVCAGPMLWEMDQAADVMKWYREFIVQAPEEINGFFAFMTVPPAPPFPDALHFKKMCAIVWCYTGGQEQANQILDPIRNYRPPAFEFFAPMPHPMLQSLFDGLYPPGLQWYWKADFFKELSDAAIATHIEHAKNLP